MKVKEAMHKGVDWVSPDTLVTELAKLMREHDIGAIPIGENDRLWNGHGPRYRLQRIGAGRLRRADRDGARCDDSWHPLLPRRRGPRQGGAAHGGTEDPQVAGHQQEQADGRHPQPG
jgi:CBS domain-containing protein